jgi:glycosyltransferase involved in cell wall biosynthesis
MINGKASIIIPVYNGANFLNEAIDSALAQTYKNFEIIVVNDGSTDHGLTREIALSYGDLINYYEQENGGVASAINYGLKVSQGEWIYWLSHDDLYSPTRISDDMEFVKNNPQAKVLYSDFYMINEKGAVFHKAIFDILKIKSVREVLEQNGMHFCAITLHRSVFDQVGFYNVKNWTMQDVEMVIRIARDFVFYKVGPKFNTSVRALPSLTFGKYNNRIAYDMKLIGNLLMEPQSLKSYFSYEKATNFDNFYEYYYLGNYFRFLGDSKNSNIFFQKAFNDFQIPISQKAKYYIKYLISKVRTPENRVRYYFLVSLFSRIKKS